MADLDPEELRGLARDLEGAVAGAEDAAAGETAAADNARRVVKRVRAQTAGSPSGRRMVRALSVVANDKDRVARAIRSLARSEAAAAVAIDNYLDGEL